MKALFLKDLLLSRTVLLLGVVLVASPFLLNLSLLSYMRYMGEEVLATDLGAILLQSASASVFLGCFTILLLTASLIAGERRERTAEFTAYLPPSRSQILTSKFLVCLTWAVALGVAYLLIVDVLVPWLSNNDQVQYGDNSRFFILSTAISAFGLAWLASCIMESPPIVVLIGIVAPIVIMYSGLLIETSLGWPNSEISRLWFYLGTQTVAGLLGITLGWSYFVRKVEPS